MKPSTADANASILEVRYIVHTTTLACYLMADRACPTAWEHVLQISYYGLAVTPVVLGALLVGLLLCREEKGKANSLHSTHLGTGAAAHT